MLFRRRSLHRTAEANDDRAISNDGAFTAQWLIILMAALHMDDFAAHGLRLSTEKKVCQPRRPTSNIQTHPKVAIAMSLKAEERRGKYSRLAFWGVIQTENGQAFMRCVLLKGNRNVWSCVGLLSSESRSADTRIGRSLSLRKSLPRQSGWHDVVLATDSRRIRCVLCPLTDVSLLGSTRIGTIAISAVCRLTGDISKTYTVSEDRGTEDGNDAKRLEITEQQRLRAVVDAITRDTDIAPQVYTCALRQSIVGVSDSTGQRSACTGWSTLRQSTFPWTVISRPSLFLYLPNHRCGSSL